MINRNFKRVFLPVLILLLAACTPAASLPVTGTTAAVAKGTASPTSGDSGVPACAYVPGVSQVAQITQATLIPAPTPTLWPHDILNSAVSADITAEQLDLYQQIWKTVKDNYVDLNYNGVDWQAIGDKYNTLIRQGMKQDAFYQAMQQMIQDLDGGQSRYYSPSEWAAEESAANGMKDYVGIGGWFKKIERPEPVIVLAGLLPGSPAEKAGLKSHDTIVQVDGGPAFDIHGNPATLGPEGSSLTITVQSPGQPPRQVKLARARVSGSTPLQYCLVPNTHIGYIHQLNYSDPHLSVEVAKALSQMASTGPLQGIILDTRDPFGEMGNIQYVRDLLSLFTKGDLGSIVTHGQKDPFTVDSPMNVQNSQTVPLVVLQDQYSGQLEQLLGGALQVKERAWIVGQPMTEPMYIMQRYPFSDGSMLVLAHSTFQPAGKPVGYFNQNGVMPDVFVPSRWDLFTEATDPVLAKAVDLLNQPKR